MHKNQEKLNYKTHIDFYKNTPVNLFFPKTNTMRAIAPNYKTITASTSSPFRSIPSSSSRGSATSVRLGKRWAEFQGLNDWAGLLHPQLDPTLRSEILRYGQFVQAAYNCFDCDPSSLSFATCRYPKDTLLPNSGLPNTGYVVMLDILIAKD